MDFRSKLGVLFVVGGLGHYAAGFTFEQSAFIAFLSVVGYETFENVGNATSKKLDELEEGIRQLQERIDDD